MFLNVLLKKRCLTFLSGGSGAIVYASFALHEGDIIHILCGESGTNNVNNTSGGTIFFSYEKLY